MIVNLQYTKSGYAVKYNQLIYNGNFEDGSIEPWENGAHVSASIDSDGAMKIETIDTGIDPSNYWILNATPQLVKQSHKYYVGATSLVSKASGAWQKDLYFLLRNRTGSGAQSVSFASEVNSYKSSGAIITSDYENPYLWFYPNKTSELGYYWKMKEIYLIDLTEMYGAGYEPTTAEEVEADLLVIGKSGYQPKNDGKFIPIGKRTGYLI